MIDDLTGVGGFDAFLNGRKLPFVRFDELFDRLGAEE
jgi:hypothetical protein